MPILATLRTLTSGKRRVIPVDDRRLEFHTLDGSDVISWTGREYVLRSGIQGLRMAPRDVISESVPGLPGARLREVRTLPRTVVLPFFMDAGSGDYRDHLAQLAQVRAYMDFRGVDYQAAEGTFDLVAYTDGSQRSLRCTYVDGMEGVEGVDDGGGSEWSTFDVRLLAVDPFWRGKQWTTPVVGLPSANPFLSEDATFSGLGRMSLSPSVALGAEMPVTLGGDVPSTAVIEGTGPWSSMHITSPQGLDVTVGPVGAGHSLLIDTGRFKRCEVDGVAAWALLGDSPQWRPLPPGDASISVVVAGATSATTARVYGTELWESAW